MRRINLIDQGDGQISNKYRDIEEEIDDFKAKTDTIFQPFKTEARKVTHKQTGLENNFLFWGGKYQVFLPGWVDPYIVSMLVMFLSEKSSFKGYTDTLRILIRYIIFIIIQNLMQNK